MLGTRQVLSKLFLIKIRENPYRIIRNKETPKRSIAESHALVNLTSKFLDIDFPGAVAVTI